MEKSLLEQFKEAYDGSKLSLICIDKKFDLVYCNAAAKKYHCLLCMGNGLHDIITEKEKRAVRKMLKTQDVAVLENPSYTLYKSMLFIVQRNEKGKAEFIRLQVDERLQTIGDTDFFRDGTNFDLLVQDALITPLSRVKVSLKYLRQRHADDDDIRKYINATNANLDMVANSVYSLEKLFRMLSHEYYTGRYAIGLVSFLRKFAEEKGIRIKDFHPDFEVYVKVNPKAFDELLCQVSEYLLSLPSKGTLINLYMEIDVDICNATVVMTRRSEGLSAPKDVFRFSYDENGKLTPSLAEAETQVNAYDGEILFLHGKNCYVAKIVLPKVFNYNGNIFADPMNDSKAYVKDGYLTEKL